MTEPSGVELITPAQPMIIEVLVPGQPGPGSNFATLLAAMQTAGVLTSGQVQAITDALNGTGPIVVPIPGTLDFSDPDNSGLSSVI